MVLLVRAIRFKYFKSSNFGKMVDGPLLQAWLEMVRNPQDARRLELKKKAASKVLLRFVLRFSDRDTVMALKAILIRIDGFCKAITGRLIQSCPIHCSPAELPSSEL